jgi:CBS domain-containing protein
MNEFYSEFMKMRRELDDMKQKERPDFQRSESRFDGQQPQQQQQQQQTPDQWKMDDYRKQITTLDSSVRSMMQQIENLKKDRSEQGDEGSELTERFAGIETQQPQQNFGGGGGGGGGGGRQQGQGLGRDRPNRPRPLTQAERRSLIDKKPNNLKDTFMLEPIEDIAFSNWRRKRLVLIGEERLAERALTRIASHNVHTIPVVSSRGQGVIGTIDIFDIVQGLINAVDRTASNTLQQGIRRDFMNKPASTLLSKQAYVISSRSNLYTALRKLLEVNQDRFVIVDRQVEGDVAPLDHPENDVDGMLTMSDVLQFLVSNSMLMRQNQYFHKTLRELGLGQQAPKTIHTKTWACDAFREIGRQCSMGLAVVDDNGQLVGNISSSDLKGITRANCAILNGTVDDFLSRDQKKGWWHRPFCLDLNDTLYHAVHQFVSTGYHHAYIMNSNGSPSGEINHRDILNQVWRSFQ